MNLACHYIFAPQPLAMKINTAFLPLLAVSAAAFLAFTNSSSAQIFARDDAAGYTNAPGGANYAWLFQTTTNGGFVFNPWVFRRGGSGFQGFFVGNVDAIASPNGNFWAINANSASGDNVAVAYRSFTNALQVNTVFKIKWHTKGIGFSATHRGGFSLRNGNANATTNDFDTGARFDFHYVGGGSDSFLITDGSGDTVTGLNF